MEYRLRVGLFGIGLDTYWPQFPGLKERLEGYIARVEATLSRSGVEIVNLGLIDSPRRATEAAHAFCRADIDLLLLQVTTYALSATVLPIVRRVKTPVIVLDLAPGAAIDYNKFNRLPDRSRMTGEWLAWCQACPLPEIANVFARAGIPFLQVTGMLENDSEAERELTEWIEAARVAHVMEHNRLGLMGHYYGGMLDIYSDLTQQAITFGGHIDMLTVDELSARRGEVTPAQLEGRMQKFHNAFDVQRECSQEELERAARTSVALDRLVEDHALGSFAYYHQAGGGSENAEAIRSIIPGNSLLTARGIPVAGEYEVKNAQAMKIMDAFGAGGSFTEFYAMDYRDDVVLMGHDGPGHPGIAQGKVKVKPLDVFHGKVGAGLSVEMSVKTGPATLLSVVQNASGKTKLLAAEAESVAGPILEIGNSNSRYRFPIGARNFVERWNAEGPAHHCAAGSGHVADTLRKFAAITGCDFVQIS